MKYRLFAVNSIVMAKRNANLAKAKQAANDEWYTKYEDIDDELYYYTTDREDLKITNQFKDKIVLCNCDDPEWSEFYKYFDKRFTAIGLKKLISTHYAKDGSASYALIKERVGINIECKIQRLEENGDFRSDECIAFLNECDIVCTNPPFSLMRQFIQALIGSGKHFLIIGPNNACHYSDLFPYIRDNKIWLGNNVSKKAMQFKTPDGKYVSKPTCWYTNMECSYRHELLDLADNYYENPSRYHHYENLDNAINVNAVDDIPGDWAGLIGVPDSILKKLNPDQFEIIGLGNGKLGQAIGVGSIKQEHKKMMKSHAARGDIYYMLDGTPKVPFSRIIVRLKKPRQKKEKCDED